MRSPLFPPERVTVMAVLNVTPDSFSDGGRLLSGGRPALDAVLAEARRLEAAGVHVLDVGGESTRPGAAEVPAAVEIARTAPVVEALARTARLPISIDTRKGTVARAALAAGATVVNDVSGGRFDPDLLAAAAEHAADLVLGHLRGVPATMQEAPHFEDVLAEVADELGACVERAVAAGVVREQIAVDPGIGFGKRLEDNLALLANAGWLAAQVGRPVLVGPSRKSFLGRLTGDPVEARDVASAAACAVAVFAGAAGIRVHDPGAGIRAAAVAAACRAARREPASDGAVAPGGARRDDGAERVRL